MALDDTDWKPNEYLQNTGHIKFLDEKSKERKNELRLSRQSSFMT